MASNNGNPLIAALRADSPAKAKSAQGPISLRYPWMDNTQPNSVTPIAPALKDKTSPPPSGLTPPPSSLKLLPSNRGWMDNAGDIHYTQPGPNDLGIWVNKDGTFTPFSPSKIDKPPGVTTGGVTTGGVTQPKIPVTPIGIPENADSFIMDFVNAQNAAQSNPPIQKPAPVLNQTPFTPIGMPENADPMIMDFINAQNAANGVATPVKKNVDPASLYPEQYNLYDQSYEPF
jgi:hypothetical protein